MIRALVVDDAREMADGLCQMLALLDVQAEAAYGPRPAILALNEGAPDVIFLDINMPGLSGYELLAYLRREPRFYEIPVIVITSDDQPNTAQRALEEGALQVLVKPVTFEMLADALRAAKLIQD